MKPTCRILWAGNLLMSDLTLALPSRSNDGSLSLLSCLSGGYRFASVLRCVGLVFICVKNKCFKWAFNVLCEVHKDPHKDIFHIFCNVNLKW